MGWRSALSGLIAKFGSQPVTKAISLGIWGCGSLVLGVSGAAAAPSFLEQQLGRQIMSRSVQVIDRTSEQLYSSSQSPTPPFALDGKPVYVLRRGKWLEARLQSYQWNSRVGFRYTVEYMTAVRIIEKAVPPHRIRSLTQARNSGILTHSYNLSTKTAIAEMLQAHNTWRQRYGVPPLMWSPQLATYAQEWANVLVGERLLRHRQQDQYGENLASASGKQLSPTTVVRLWGEEDKYYNYSTNTCQRGQMCGHYTQLVWRNTREVGCAMARNSQREVWVCNYDPPGNYVGQRPY
jgi:pathogenesis-related protein 1